VAVRACPPTGSFLADRVQEPDPAERVIAHNVVLESLTLTTPVGVEPGNSGVTLTANFSAPSLPYTTLGAETERAVVEEAGATVRFPVVEEEPAKSVLPP
jgi:hypothetical protein